MLSWFDAHPACYGGLIGLTLVVALGLVLRACWRPVSHAPTHSDWRWGGIIFSLLAAGRWPSWFYTRQLNPDESHLITGAFTLRHDPVFWRSIDGGSAGPLDFYALWPIGWLHGADDFFSARVTAFFVLTLVLLFAHQTIALIFGRAIARVGSFATVCFVALTPGNDFLHYSSELAAMLPLAAGTLLAVRRFWADGDGRWNLLGGFLLGAVPFAKLQAAPLALVVGIAWIVGECRLRTSQPPLTRRLLALAGSALLPSLGIASVLSFTGQWPHALIPYFFYNQHYITANRVPLGTAVRQLALASSRDGALLFPWLLGGGIALVILAAVARRLPPRPAALNLALVATLFFFASVACVLTPGRPFLHYCQFLVLPSILLLGAALGGLAGPARETLSASARRVVLCAVLFVSVGPVLVTRAQQSPRFIGELVFWRDHQQSRLAAALTQLTRPDEAVAVWGWMNQIYAESGRRAATRSIQSEPMILQNHDQAYYRQRYLNDLAASRAPVFLDAVGSGDFLFRDPSFRHEVIFPELGRYVQTHYTLIAEFQGSRIFLRNDRVGTTANALP
jgi:hypothetical protein